MCTKKMYFLLLLTLSPLAMAGKQSNFINFGGFLCPREEKALGRCLRDTLNTFIPQLAKGVPEFGVPSCEPLIIPELTFQQTRGPVTVTSHYTEVTVRGPSTMKIKEITVDPNSHKVTAQLQIKELKLKGRYQITGQVLMLPIEGEGLFSGKYEDIDAEVRISLGRIPRAGEADSLTCEELDVSFKVGNANMHLDNLFGGDDQLGRAMNKFLNDNWQKVSDEMQPAMAKSLRDFLKPLADHAFSTLNADDILN